MDNEIILKNDVNKKSWFSFIHSFCNYETKKGHGKYVYSYLSLFFTEVIAKLFFKA